MNAPLIIDVSRTAERTLERAIKQLRECIVDRKQAETTLDTLKLKERSAVEAVKKATKEMQAGKTS